jgi:hypothetical protein
MEYGSPFRGAEISVLERTGYNIQSTTEYYSGRFVRTAKDAENAENAE